MCGRFTLRTPASEWCQLFLPHADSRQLDPVQLDPGLDDPPRYNIAPTQPIACVLGIDDPTQAPGRGHHPVATKLRWGLIPPWAVEPSIGNRMINARSETVDSKPSFRNAFARRRCLIPADGYFEWKKTSGGKQPYLIERHDGGILAMAGIWEENLKLAQGDQPLRTCTILTTSANRKTAAIHDRMPVFLESQFHSRWLDPDDRDTEALKRWLLPADEDLLRLTAVSRHVNRPIHDDPECVRPIGDAADDEG